MFQPRWWLLVLMIFAAAALRLVDRPWNLAPVGALALFAGAHFRAKSLAFFVPIAAMFLSDLGLGLIHHNMQFYAFHSMVPLVYGCYAVSVCLGLGVRRCWQHQLRAEHAPDATGLSKPVRRYGRRVVPVVSATLAGAVLFFVVTNFGVWMFFPTHPKTWDGLLLCYEQAIPFFRTTLVGDTFYVVVLFGGYDLLKHKLPVLEESGLLITD